MITRSSAEVLVAAVAAFGVGLRLPLPMGLTTSLVLGALLVPLWLSVVPRFEGARTVTICFLGATVFGLFLTWASSLRLGFDSSLAIATSINYWSIFLGAGVLWWCRTIIGTALSALLLSASLLLSVSRSNPDVIANPFKFGYGVPLTIAVLAIAMLIGVWWVQFAALAVIGLLALTFDSRSFFAVILLTIVILWWQKIAQAVAGRSLFLATAGLVVASAGVYRLASTLAAAGGLGTAAAARTIAQEQSSGSLLLGGRPELAATWALFREYPMGFGLGSPPTLPQILVAKEGMVAIGYNPFNGYVERYMLGGRFELHSLGGDFWAHMGLAGLALAVLIVAVMIKGLLVQMRAENASALVVFLALMLFWNVAFSPLFASIGATLAALAFVPSDREATQDVSTPQPESLSDTPAE